MSTQRRGPRYLLASLLLTTLGCGEDTPHSEPSETRAQQVTVDAGEPRCAVSSLRPGTLQQTMRHGGRERSYILYVPARHEAGTQAPLVIDMHGFSRTAASQKAGSGWDKLADRVGALVVYPQGVSSSWNVGGCCGTAGSANVDDVGFIKAIVAKLVSEACVDPKRVYASGVSNGAGMAGRLSCEAADVIAGVSLVSSDLRTQPCRPARPVTEIAFRGMADALEPYEGGIVGPPGGQYTSPGARGSFELYRKLNQCTGNSVETIKYCETYTTCAEGSQVTLCSLPGVGHAPYTNRLGVDVAQASWDAFVRAPRP